MLDELGPTFVKFGQLLSIRPDLMPPEIISELRLLQDSVSPFSYEEVQQVIRQELNGIGYPATVFYDRTGKLVYTHQGQYRTEAELAADIQRYSGQAAR